MIDTMESDKRILHFVAGRHAPVEDLLGIGRYKKPEAGLSPPSLSNLSLLGTIAWCCPIENSDVNGMYIMFVRISLLMSIKF